MKEYGGVEIYFHVVLTLNLDGGEWVCSRLDRFIPRKKPRYPLNTRLDGLQNRPRRSKEDRNLLFLQEFQARTAQLVAQSLYRQRYSG